MTKEDVLKLETEENRIINCKAIRLNSLTEMCMQRGRLVTYITK